MLPRIGHALTVLLSIHALLQLIHVVQGLHLLIPKALQLTLSLLTGLFILGLLQRGFSLTQTTGHVLLSPGQVSKTVEHLQIFTLLRLILVLGQTLVFVSILLLPQLQLLQLTIELLRIPGVSIVAAVSRLRDLVLAFAQFEQGLIRQLLGRHGLWQGFAGASLDRLGQVTQRRIHGVRGNGQRTRRFRVLGLGQSTLATGQGIGLRVSHQCQIFCHGTGICAQVGALFYIPGGRHDLFLQLSELFALKARRLLTVGILRVLRLLLLGLLVHE